MFKCYRLGLKKLVECHTLKVRWQKHLLNYLLFKVGCFLTFYFLFSSFSKQKWLYYGGQSTIQRFLVHPYKSLYSAGNWLLPNISQVVTKPDLAKCLASVIRENICRSRWVSNLQPSDYESGFLPSKLNKGDNGTERRWVYLVTGFLIKESRIQSIPPPSKHIRGVIQNNVDFSHKTIVSCSM